MPAPPPESLPPIVKAMAVPEAGAVPEAEVLGMGRMSLASIAPFQAMLSISRCAAPQLAGVNGSEE
jgi:hypothetical protein